MKLTIAFCLFAAILFTACGSSDTSFVIHDDNNKGNPYVLTSFYVSENKLKEAVAEAVMDAGWQTRQKVLGLYLISYEVEDQRTVENPNDYTLFVCVKNSEASRRSWWDTKLYACARVSFKATRTEDFPTKENPNKRPVVSITMDPNEDIPGKLKPLMTAKVVEDLKDR